MNFSFKRIQFLVFIFFCGEIQSTTLSLKYGLDIGDDIFNREQSSSESVPFNYQFGDFKMNEVSVGSNGNLGLGAENYEFFELYVYFSFLDTRYGQIYYRIINDGETLSSINKLIQNNFPQMQSFTSNFCLVVTWDQVVPASSVDLSINNTFQVVFSSNSTHNFFLINYLNLKWERGNDGLSFNGLRYMRHMNSVQYEKYIFSNETNPTLLSTSSNFGVPGSFLFGFANDLILPNHNKLQLKLKIFRKQICHLD